VSKNIIIFASGAGSNAIQIWHHAQVTNAYCVAAIFCNNAHAGIIQFCENNNITCEVFTNALLKEKIFLNTIQAYNPTLIILAGFLQKIPSYLVAAYPNKIINIHPALLPKYGGVGMYGKYVHEAVCAAKETTTGITIHYVNEYYDDGAIIFQEQVSISHQDTASTIAQKVLHLEHQYYKTIIAQLLDKTDSLT
jgi:phosphoribosylglycinamide formyltransferase 1